MSDHKKPRTHNRASGPYHCDQSVFCQGSHKFSKHIFPAFSMHHFTSIFPKFYSWNNAKKTSAELSLAAKHKIRINKRLNLEFPYFFNTLCTFSPNFILFQSPQNRFHNSILFQYFQYRVGILLCHHPYLLGLLKGTVSTATVYTTNDVASTANKSPDDKRSTRKLENQYPLKRTTTRRLCQQFSLITSQWSDKRLHTDKRDVDMNMGRERGSGFCNNNKMLVGSRSTWCSQRIQVMAPGDPVYQVLIVWYLWNLKTKGFP